MSMGGLLARSRVTAISSFAFVFHATQKLSSLSSLALDHYKALLCGSRPL